MGFFNADLVIFTAFKEGIRRVKENLYLVDSINEDIVADPLLAESFGQKEVDRMRNFVSRNDVPITFDHKPPETFAYPCISIGIGQGSEEPSNRLSLGDDHDTSMIDPQSLQGYKVTPRIILGPITPDSYDQITGQITMASTVDLTNVYPGQFVFDEKNQKPYKILLVMDNTVLIEPDSTPNLTGMTIRPSTNLVGNTKKKVYCRENYTITCVSKDPVEATYVFQLAVLVMLRFKEELFDSRGFAVQTFSYSAIQEGNDGSPNLVWYRTINLSGRVPYEWSNTISEPIDGINSKLKITDQNADDIKSPPGQDVKKQNWDMSGDEE